MKPLCVRLGNWGEWRSQAQKRENAALSPNEFEAAAPVSGLRDSQLVRAGIREITTGLMQIAVLCADADARLERILVQVRRIDDLVADQDKIIDAAHCLLVEVELVQCSRGV